MIKDYIGKADIIAYKDVKDVDHVVEKTSSKHRAGFEELAK